MNPNVIGAVGLAIWLVLAIGTHWLLFCRKKRS